MSNNIKKGYKVTQIEDDGTHTSLVVQYLAPINTGILAEYTYYYPQGKWAYQREGQGPLAVFDRHYLGSATQFAQAEAGTLTPLVCVSECEYEESPYHYLWYAIGEEEFPLLDVPPGTRFATRVKRGKAICIYKGRSLVTERVDSRGLLRRVKG